MLQSTLLQISPFPFACYFTAVAIAVLLTWLGVIGKSINALIWVMAWEAKRRNENDICDELIKSTDRSPNGRTIGTLESIYYLYVLFAQVPALISAVFLFKAFTGWIGGKSRDVDAGMDSQQTLVRFYTYAVGNMMSLLWSIAIFEIVRWSLRFPQIYDLLWFK